MLPGLTLAGFVTGLVVRSPRPARLPIATRTLTLLRSEALAFLVTDRLVTQIAVSSREHSVLLGCREGYLVATVRLYHGLDLAALTPADIRREGERVVVRVPAPRELDFAVDPGSIRIIQKRSGPVVVADWLGGRDLEAELRARLHEDALSFLRAHDLIPPRAALVARLNAWAPHLGANLGVELRFE